jgi:hypothetical protein
VVAGGSFNTASGGCASVLGGDFNRATACKSTVGGGNNNLADATNSAILGGVNNNTCGFGDSMIVGSNINADRVCATFVNNLSIMSIPTSAAGLPAGSVWNNSGVLNIV